MKKNNVTLFLSPTRYLVLISAIKYSLDNLLPDIETDSAKLTCFDILLSIWEDIEKQTMESEVDTYVR